LRLLFMRWQAQQRAYGGGYLFARLFLAITNSQYRVILGGDTEVRFDVCFDTRFIVVAGDSEFAEDVPVSYCKSTQVPSAPSERLRYVGFAAMPLKTSPLRP
jgi:hypothetical protein